MNPTEEMKRGKNWMELAIYDEEADKAPDFQKSTDVLRKTLSKDKFDQLEKAREKDLYLYPRHPWDILEELVTVKELREVKQACVRVLDDDLEKEKAAERENEPAVSREQEESADAGNTTEQLQEMEPEVREPEIHKSEGPNMAEVQAAELKASLVQGLDRSADGNTQIEGKDIGYSEEGYVAAADQVKYEAQRARTADRENRNIESLQNSINPKIGQRVTFQPHGIKTKLTGKVVDMDDETVTLQSGRAVIPAIRDKGTFREAPEPERSHTKEYAKEQAQKHVGEQGKVFLARGRGETYKGDIVEMTPTFAIQKVNAETAILHRLKDLETKEKDGHGIPLELIREGQEVSITRESREKGGVVIEPWDRAREEKQKVRELERSRGSQSH